MLRDDVAARGRGLALAALVGLGVTRAAAAFTPVPPFPTDGLAVAGVEDTFERLRAFVSTFHGEVGATYHVAIVQYSDALDRPGPEWGGPATRYDEAVVTAWRGSLDATTGVVVILSLANHDVWVHPGSRWATLGFTGPAVRKVIDASAFGVNAAAGDHDTAVELLVRAVDAHLLRLVTAREEERQAARRTLDGVRAEHERVAALVAAATVDTTSAAAHLAGAGALLRSAEERLAAEAPAHAVDRARHALSELELADGDLEAERIRHQVVTRVAPAAAAGTVALVLLGALLAVRLHRRARRRLAETAIAEWERLLGLASERLLALENEHPLLLRDDLVGRHEGATLEPVRAVARRVDDLFVACETAQRVLLEAKGMAGRTGPLRWKGFDRAARRLADDQIVVRTEDVAERRLFLPDRREVRVPARQLLADMESAFTAATSELRALERHLQAEDAARAASAARLAEAEAAEVRMAARGLVVPAVRQERRELVGAHAEVAARSARDPIGASADLAALGARIETLRSRASRLDDTSARLHDVVRPVSAAVAEAMAVARADGFTLAEPGFEPDVMLERGTRLASDAWRAAEAGRDEEASRDAHEAAATLQSLRELIEATRASRIDTPRRLAEQRTRAALLASRGPQRLLRLDELRAAHADEALQPALDNAAEADAALSFAAACNASAERALGPDQQAYLRAAELARRGADALAGIEALDAEVEAKAAELEGHRDATKRLVEELRRELDALEALLAGQAAWARPATHAARKDLRELTAALTAEARVTRPRWPDLHARAERGARAAADAHAIAAADHSAWQSVQEIEPRVRAEAAAVGALLASTTDDRPPANERHAEASAALAAADALLAGEPREWAQALLELQRAERHLRECRRLATADVSEATAARDALAAGDRALRRADHAYAHGVVADLRASRDALLRAADALRRGEYAAARQAALDAERGAAAAERAAMARASAIALTQAVATGLAWRGTWGARDLPRPGATSGRGWPGGGGHGGGAGAGHSSFGSSSGHSSFGSSSGHAKW